MLLPRILTAIVGIPFFLYMIHLGKMPFLVFVLGLSVLALYEYALILWTGGRGVQRCWTVLGGALIMLAVALDGAGRQASPGIGLVDMALTLLVVVAMISELLRKEHSLDRAAVTVFGALFVGWTLGHLVLIRDRVPNGEAFTFLLFASVWATDTLAYFSGRAFGKRKLAKVISPKKTWEGALGGLLGAVGTMWLARKFFLPDLYGATAAVGLGLLVGTIGQMSDLSQSLIKRAAGAKDSSSLLPGHGGIFDRMDSFLLLAPLYYYVLLVCSL
jgi:phosphatidate cytidylyltransferase